MGEKRRGEAVVRVALIEERKTILMAKVRDIDIKLAHIQNPLPPACRAIDCVTPHHHHHH